MEARELLNDYSFNGYLIYIIKILIKI